MLVPTKRLFYSAVFCLFISGCTGPGTQVKESPLEPEEVEVLNCTLIGTWELQFIDGESAEGSEVSWTFRGDGTGIYDQTGRGLPVPGGQNPFDWRVEGRNVYLKLSSVEDKELVYRAEEWTDSTMVWFNYKGSNDYGVKRIGEMTGCGKTEEPEPGEGETVLEPAGADELPEEGADPEDLPEDVTPEVPDAEPEE